VKPAWAVVPAKSFARGKSRLTPVLANDERAVFARELFERVLGVTRASVLDGTLVATDGEDVAAIAERLGAHVLRDEQGDPLAGLIDRALSAVAARGARSAVVLMADLPFLEARDVDALVASLASHEVVVVRDHLGRHTNALGLSPPTVMRTCFGRPDSFADHCAAAHAAGLRTLVVENDRVAFDVDGPADHLAFTQRRPRAEI
jgi:2-phospho-L-lactate guanylyltransferase